MRVLLSISQRQPPDDIKGAIIPRLVVAYSISVYLSSMNVEVNDMSISLDDDEQLVLAVTGRVLLTLHDVILLCIVFFTLIFIPLLIIHRIFRPVIYVITTKRVCVIEPRCAPKFIVINDIKKFRGTHKSLLIYTDDSKLWLPRLPDAWLFESVITKTRKIVLADPAQH